jgi:predicted RNA binding protein YcfA (HicA-like mRNA interferase family)
MKKEAWDRLKNLSCDDLISLLKEDGWKLIRENGALRTYHHSSGRQVTIHYHSRKNYGNDLMKDLIRDIGWTEVDLQRLKLIK